MILAARIGALSMSPWHCNIATLPEDLLCSRSVPRGSFSQRRENWTMKAAAALPQEGEFPRVSQRSQQDGAGFPRGACQSPLYVTFLYIFIPVLPGITSQVNDSLLSQGLLLGEANPRHEFAEINESLH